MVIWLIGMSGSGKTTIGKQLFNKLVISKNKWVFLDGDVFRNILGEDLGHSIEDRRKNAYRISRFCEFLSLSNINVVACVLSIFHDNQKYNRENIQDYKEIYLEVGMDKLIERDNKQLYVKAKEGKIKNVVGMDIEFTPPLAPDYILNNNKDNISFDAHIEKIIKSFGIALEDSYSYTRRNLLHYPEKYQYSDFQGKDFFNKYRDDRAKCISYLTTRINMINEDQNLIKEPVINKKYYEKNNLLLKEFLSFILSCDVSNLKEDKSILLTIIKRFEVSKKLYKTYSKVNIRKSSKEYKDILNYSLFSLVLQKFHNKTKVKEEKMIYLNSILKVNDILSSIRKDIVLQIDIKYTIRSMKGELELTKNLI
jgi:adenylylsulfate kinase-like enzyme